MTDFFISELKQAKIEIENIIGEQNNVLQRLKDIEDKIQTNLNKIDQIPIKIQTQNKNQA